jgi:hypothetical protein
MRIGILTGGGYVPGSTRAFLAEGDTSGTGAPTTSSDTFITRLTVSVESGGSAARQSDPTG